MMMTSIWRLSLPLLTALAVVACAHAPAPMAPAPATVLVPVAPSPPPEAAAQPESAPQSPVPEIALPKSPEDYADLFDRLRAGFSLEDSDRATIDRELNWYANNPEYLERAFGRAELYLHHIVHELESRHMPLELALLPIVESAFEPYAYSRARAAGLWQFIPGTGSRFGLKQDWWYDGRRDVVESTRAALDYLQFLHDEFNGDWLLAVAGYNCGEKNIERAVEFNQARGLPIDFWSLRLPKETQAYVPKLLAMKRLVASPASYGLSFSRIPNQPYFERVATLGQIDLKLAAQIAGITYEELYELNPAFHRWATDPQGPHFLLLPVDGAAVFRQNIGQLTAEQRLGATLYTVRRHDTVTSLAKRFKTTPTVIRELNDLPQGPLIVGQELRVPAANAELPAKVMLAAARVDRPDRRSERRPHLHVVRRGDSLWAIAKKHNMDVKELALMNGLTPGERLRAGQRLRLSMANISSGKTSNSGHKGRKVTYTVRAGDTLFRIARVFQVSVAQILSWNGMDSSSAIRPGQHLTIRVSSRS